MTIAFKSPTTELERQQAAHRARRARLFGKPQKDATEPKIEPVVAPEVAIIVTYRDENPKDAHVKDWLTWRANRASKCRNHIRARCEQLGLSFDKVTGATRVKTVVRARDMIMYEIKYEVDPTISWPRLGRLFHRDHSSAIYSVLRHRARLGDPHAIEAVRLKWATQNERHKRVKMERETQL